MKRDWLISRCKFTVDRVCFCFRFFLIRDSRRTHIRSTNVATPIPAADCRTEKCWMIAHNCRGWTRAWLDVYASLANDKFRVSYEFFMMSAWHIDSTRDSESLFASVLATSEHRIDNEHRFRFEEVQVGANVRSKPNYKLYIFHVHSDERLLWRSAQRFEN